MWFRGSITTILSGGKTSDRGDGQADSHLDKGRWSKCRGTQVALVSSSSCEMFHRVPVEKDVDSMSGQ
jgi:hypothetical protein